MGTPLEVVAHDEAFLLARWEKHVVVLWRQAADPVRAQRVSEETVRAARVSPREACHLAWVLPSAAAPDAEARRVFAQMGREVGANLCCMLAVVGGDGFVSAVFRAAITGIAMAARIQFPLKLAPDIRQGAHWFSSHARPGAETLISAFETARELMDSRAQVATPQSNTPR